MPEEKDHPFQVSDRRFWVEDESTLEKASVPETRYPSFVEELKGRTELAERRLKEKLEDLERENEAFRGRLQREMERRLQQEKIRFVKGVLEVIDNLERALGASQSMSGEGLREGVQLTLDLFLNKLKTMEIEPLELEGQPFDPHVAEAVETVRVEDAEADQQVVEVLQRGYRWKDEILRPARVRIGIFDEGH